MKKEEWSPLLPQDTVGQELPLSMDNLVTPSHVGPEPQEDTMEVWSCCCQVLGTKHQAWSGGPAASLPMGSSCIKCLTFFSNFLFSLLGLLVLAVGLWGLTVKGSLGNGLGGALPPDPMLGLVFGGLVVSVVSLAGCLGALCESSSLLRCFCGAILGLLVLEALAGALVVALWGPLQDGLEHTLQVAITHYQDDPDLHFLLDQVQLGLRCCGAASYQDWQQNLYFNCSSPGVQACSLPASCCINPQEDGASVNTQCGFRVLRLDQASAEQIVYLEGCSPRLQQWLLGNIQAIGGCVIVIVLVQGAELLLATLLLRALAAPKVVGDPGPGPP
ncbi:tetraspanin-10 [Octodon degus]|uniref:Tetraspanin-10 n=1 Tax=Octodon degus TaxID=10160 RepID=A0A6P3FH76_OCTDE|nr:tetraspanin-10 [Octodon degus]